MRRYGFVQWRVAFYVAGSKDDKLVDFLQMLRDFVAWTAQKPEFKGREMPTTIVTSANQCLMSSIAEGIGGIGWEVNTMVKPLCTFDAYPPKGKRCVTMTAEATDDNNLNLLFSGYTWPFRAKFDSAEVSGGYVELEDGKREYVRIMRDVRPASTEDFETIMNVLGARVLNGCPVMLVEDENTNKDILDMMTKIKAIGSVIVR